MRRATGRAVRGRRRASVAIALLACATPALPLAARSEEPERSRAAQEPPRPADVPRLARELESQDPAERERAAAALSELARARVPEAIAALLPLLHDPSSKVRYHAEWGLAGAGEPAVPGLLAHFRSRHDDEGRARAAAVLGRIGLAAAAAVPEMRAALAEPDSSCAGRAAWALGAMQAREAIPDLVRAYAASRKTSNQREMARALARVGSDQGHRAAQAELVGSLSEALERGDSARRAATVRYLDALLRAVRSDGAADFPTREALRVLVPGLVAELDAADTERVLSAARVLALVGRDAADAAPALGRLLDDARTREQAKTTLRAIATPQAERLLEERLALEALEKRVRTGYQLRDHQSRTQLAPFLVASDGEGELRLSALFLHPGREPQPPDHVVIGLQSFAPRPRFADVRELVWTADGVPIPMKGLDRSVATAQRGGAIEELSGLLPVADFLAIANARRLRARIGGIAFAVSRPDQEALRYFAGRIPSGPAADAGP